MLTIDKARLRELEKYRKSQRCAKHPHGQLMIVPYQGGVALSCRECGPLRMGELLTTVEDPSPTQRYRRGEAIPAAMRPHIERRLGVTEESRELATMAQAAPPSRLPTADETKEVVAGFAGWTAPNSVIPQSTAVALWGLVNMGILPVHINLLGGKPYITEDGMLAHASRLIQQEGRQWGRIVYSEATAAERSLAGCNAEHEYCTKATYQERVPVKITYPDRIEETTRWDDVQSEYGRASREDTVVKVGGKEQPVERQFPGEMARARATRRVLRLVAPVRMPEGVGFMVEGHAVEVLDAEAPAIEAPAGMVMAEAAEELKDGDLVVMDDEGKVRKAAVDTATGEVIDEAPDDEAPAPAPKPRATADITPEIRNSTVAAFKAADITETDIANLSFQSEGGAFTGNGAIVAMLVAGWEIRVVVDYALNQLGRDPVPADVQPGEPYDEKGPLPW